MLYLGILAGTEDLWGRDYSTIDEIFYTALDLVYTTHRAKVVGNLISCSGVSFLDGLFDLE